MPTLSATSPSTDASPFELPRFLQRLLATDASVAPAIARVALGAVILPHGLQKTLGLFGGHGFAGTMGYFTQGVGMPWIVALLVVLAESAGALALIAGLASRFCAASIGLVMAGAIFIAHAPHGFFMNWAGNQAGEGFEFHLLALGLAAIVVVAGGGRASLDRWLVARSE